MRSSRFFLALLVLPFDALALFVAANAVFWLRLTDAVRAWRPVLFSFTLDEFLRSAGFFGVIWLIMNAVFGLYTFDLSRRFLDEFRRLSLSSISALCVLSLVIVFTQEVFGSRFLLGAGFVVGFVCLFFFRLILFFIKQTFFRFGRALLSLVVIGQNERAQMIFSQLKKKPELGYMPVFFAETVAEAEKFSGRVEVVFFAGDYNGKEEELLSAYIFANLKHAKFLYYPGVFATAAARNLGIFALFEAPVIEVRQTPLSGFAVILKNIIERILVVLFLLILSPVFIFITILIFFETGRPIFYLNERVGRHGRKFFTYKFRTMYQKDSTGVQFGESGRVAEERERELIKEKNSRTGPIYKIKDDPRVTPFGKFFRRYSLDELPQFFNVLKGDMSLVGPRPHQPREVMAYARDYPQVFAVSPGITGLAQIGGRSDLSFEEEVRLDLLYVESWSPLLDFFILLKTPFVIFRRRKAL